MTKVLLFKLQVTINVISCAYMIHHHMLLPAAMLNILLSILLKVLLAELDDLQIIKNN